MTKDRSADMLTVLRFVAFVAGCRDSVLEKGEPCDINRLRIVTTSSISVTLFSN